MNIFCTSNGKLLVLFLWESLTSADTEMGIERHADPCILPASLLAKTRLLLVKQASWRLDKQVPKGEVAGHDETYCQSYSDLSQQATSGNLIWDLVLQTSQPFYEILKSLSLAWFGFVF